MQGLMGGATLASPLSSIKTLYFSVEGFEKKRT